MAFLIFLLMLLIHGTTAKVFNSTVAKASSAALMSALTTQDLSNTDGPTLTTSKNGVMSSSTPVEGLPMKEAQASTLIWTTNDLKLSFTNRLGTAVTVVNSSLFPPTVNPHSNTISTTSTSQHVPHCNGQEATHASCSISWSGNSTAQTVLATATGAQPTTWKSKPLFLKPATELAPPSLGPQSPVTTSATSSVVQRFQPSSRRPWLPVQAVSEAPTVAPPSMGPLTAKPVTKTLIPLTELVVELPVATSQGGLFQGSSAVSEAVQDTQVSSANSEAASSVIEPGPSPLRASLSSRTTILRVETPSLARSDRLNALETDTAQPDSHLLGVVAGIAVAVGQAGASGFEATGLSTQAISMITTGPQAHHGLTSPAMQVPESIITPAPQAFGKLGVVFTFDGVRVTALQGRGPDIVIIGDTTITAGGAQVSVAGHVFRAVTNGVIVDGRTIPFTEATPTSSHGLHESAIITAGGQTFTVHHDTGSEYLAVDNQRIAVNGPSVRISGHVFAAIDDEIVVDGHTMTLSFAEGHFSAVADGDLSTSLQGSAIVTIGGNIYTVTRSSDRRTAYVSGTAISIGGAALALASRTLSLASAGIVVQASETAQTVAFTQSTVSGKGYESTSFMTATAHAVSRLTSDASTPTTAASIPLATTSPAVSIEASSAAVFTACNALVLAVALATAFYS